MQGQIKNSRKRDRKERERDVEYETYRINMFGSMALQNYKQQVAAVP